MDENKSHLKKRLDRIWEPPDFFSILGAIKRPPHLIKKGRILFSDGDVLERLYFIKEGFVKLYRVSEDGRETITYLYGPNYVVGLRALLSKDEVAKHDAEALTDLKVISLSHKEFFDIVYKYPAFLIDLSHYLLDRLEYTERAIEGFIVTDTTARIAYFFSDVIKRFCSKKNCAITLPLQFTHQRIAEFVGSFRETVTVSMHRLEKEDVLTSQGGKIVIKHLPKLHKFAQLHRNP